MTFLNQNTPTEVSTADPLEQTSRAAASTSFGKVPIIFFVLKF